MGCGPEAEQPDHVRHAVEGGMDAVRLHAHRAGEQPVAELRRGDAKVEPQDDPEDAARRARKGGQTGAATRAGPTAPARPPPPRGRRGRPPTSHPPPPAGPAARIRAVPAGPARDKKYKDLFPPPLGTKAPSQSLISD